MARKVVSKVEEIIGDYKVRVDLLRECFDAINDRLPFDKLDWVKVVEHLDWCARMRENMRVPTGFDKCYLLFQHGEAGEIDCCAIVNNSTLLYHEGVAYTVVKEFLDAVDGY